MSPKYLLIAALPFFAALTQCEAPKPKGPSPYSFQVRLQLTPEAEAKLKARGNTVTITAFYYGLAKPEFKAEADQAFRIRLGYETANYNPDAKLIRLPANDIDTKLFPKVVDGEPVVLLTASSTAPQGNPDMLLYCKSVVITVKEAQAQPPVLACEPAMGV